MTSEDANNPGNINFDENSASLRIPKDTYVRILIKAIAQTKQDIEDLEAALSEGDIEKIQAITHRLKGDYDNMRITSLSSTAGEMNKIAKENGDPQKIKILLAAFKECFQKVCQIVDKSDQAQ